MESEEWAEEVRTGTSRFFKVLGDTEYAVKTLGRGLTVIGETASGNAVWMSPLVGTCPVCLRRRPFSPYTWTMKRHLRRLKGRRDALKCKGKGRLPIEFTMVG